MLSLQRNRGPDFSQVLQVSENVILGANRLAISDPHNDSANMPFTTKSGQTNLVFNGEIYNHLTLRKSLQVNFRSRADTESIAEYIEQAYSCNSTDSTYKCLRELNGPFAFALFNQKNKNLLLARDITGQKPLYYYKCREYLIFSSDIRALMRCLPKGSLHLDRTAIAEALWQRYITAPDTHIQEIKKVVPGSILEISRESIKIFVFHNLLHDTLDSDDKCELSEVQTSLKDIFSSEVRSGLFLSSGFDSGALLEAACALGSMDHCYSLGFRLPADLSQSFDPTIPLDETGIAKVRADKNGVPFSSYMLSLEEFLSRMKEWAELMGEPMFFNETACHLALFEHASKQNTRVIFVGSGADELFDGYQFSQSLDNRKNHDIDSIAELYFKNFTYSAGVDVADYFECDFDLALRSLRNKSHQLLLPYQDFPLSTVEKIAAVMFHLRLPHTELMQMDRASMQYSIEARVPFVEKVFRCLAISPHNEQVERPSLSKLRLRNALRPLVSNEVFHADKKAFAPIGEFLCSPEFHSELRQSLNNNSPLVTMDLISLDNKEQLIQEQNPYAAIVRTRAFLLSQMLSSQREFFCD